MKRIWLVVVIVVVPLTVVFGYRWVTAVRNQTNMVSTVQNLKDIALATVAYHERTGKYPTSVANLKIDEHSLYDPSTESPFVYHFPPITQPGYGYLMVAQQSRAVRVSWLGEQRRYAAFVEGSVIDIFPK